MFLIVMNVILIAIHTTTVSQQDWKFERMYHSFELFSFAIFFVEYVLRLWTAVEDPSYSTPCRGRVRWAMQPLNALDLIALLPYAVDVLTPSDQQHFRGGTAIRLFRVNTQILRLERGFGSFARIHAVMRNKGDELLVTVFVASIMLIVSSSVMYYIENDVNPNFSDLPTTLYWSAITLATVGYGDIVPITPWGRVIGSITAFVGVGFFALPAGIIGSGFVEVMMDEKRANALARQKRLKEKQAGAAPPREPGVATRPSTRTSFLVGAP